MMISSTYGTFLNKVNDVALSVGRPESVDCQSAVG